MSTTLDSLQRQAVSYCSLAPAWQKHQKNKTPFPAWKRGFSVESEGFEPPDLLQSAVFKTAAIDHSASSLDQLLLRWNTQFNKKGFPQHRKSLLCREGGIRTPDTVAGITVFETVAFDHSATSLSGSPSDWGVQKYRSILNEQ